ncbi:hypothetical protein D3C72_1461880 [compost metagenome]
MQGHRITACRTDLLRQRQIGVIHGGFQRELLSQQIGNTAEISLALPVAIQIRWRARVRQTSIICKRGFAYHVGRPPHPEEFHRPVSQGIRLRCHARLREFFLGGDRGPDGQLAELIAPQVIVFEPRGIEQKRHVQPMGECTPRCILEHLVAEATNEFGNDFRHCNELESD